MAPTPFTHHEIFRLIGPFSSRGYQADLSASNRLERRLLFKPIVHPAKASGSPPLAEVMELENSKSGIFSLTRRLSASAAASGRLEAELLIEGTAIEELLKRINEIPVEMQFRFGSNFGIAKSYRLQDGPAAPAGAVQSDPQLIFTRASGCVEGLSLTFSPPKLRVDSDCLIEIRPQPGEGIVLPEDLLAVLGWNWGLIRRLSQVCKANLRISGSEPERSRKAEHKLDQMIDHLSATLAAPPAQFHDSFARARWQVAFRRSIPLLIGLILIGGAVATLNTDFAQNSPFRMWMFNGPPLLLISIFCMREIPSIEIPPIPRRSRNKSWRHSQHAQRPAQVVQKEAPIQNSSYFRR